MPAPEAGALGEKGGSSSKRAVEHGNCRVGQDWVYLGQRAITGPRTVGGHSFSLPGRPCQFEICHKCFLHIPSSHSETEATNVLLNLLHLPGLI